jgi:hypothetical protein
MATTRRWTTRSDRHPAGAGEELAASLAREVAEVLPRFSARGPLLRSLKSHLLRGTVDGAPVFIKKLARDEPLWRWYFERELRLYRRFADAPPHVPVPRLLHADPARSLLVLEDAGEPLSMLRRLRGELDTPTRAALLAAPGAIASYRSGAQPASPAEVSPSPPAHREMRRRLLEDPSDPLGWVVQGIARAARLGLLEAGLAARMDRALAEHPALAFAHGDLLPRNLLRSPEGRLVVIDWECSGAHPEGWDRALLWANAPSLRAGLEAALASSPPPSRRAFWACVGFALARELKFRRPAAAARAPAGEDPVTAVLRGELVLVDRALGY